MKRLFVAIDAPEWVGRSVAQARALLESDGYRIRWAPPENIHLTLKFLGSREDEQVSEIAGSLAKALEEIAPFSAATDIFGVFPSEKRARVLWLGVRENEELRHVYSNVIDALEGHEDPMGPKAEKVFHPHITIGRLKFPQSIDIDKLNSKIRMAGELIVDEVTLYSSRPSERGAEYTKEAGIRLIAQRT